MRDWECTAGVTLGKLTHSGCADQLICGDRPRGFFGTRRGNGGTFIYIFNFLEGKFGESNWDKRALLDDQEI